MAELEYGTVVGQYRLVSAGTERAAEGVVRFSPVEPDETTDFATVYTREAFNVTLDEEGWLRSEGGQVDELRVPAGRWEASFRNVPGLTVKPFQFDVPAGDTVILPQVQPLIPSPAVKFVVNEQVYTETLAARVAAEDARDIAVQAAEDATAPTEQVVDARIDAKRNTANGLAPLGPDSKVPLARIPVAAIASSAEVGAVVDDAIEPALTDITDLKTKTTTGYLAPAKVAPLVGGKLPEANVPDRLTETGLSATFVSSFIVAGPGIDPTGVTDSSAAIQAILTAAGAVKGRVIFPRGKYLCDNLSIPAYVTVEGFAGGQYRFGAGAAADGGTVLLHKAGATNPLVIINGGAVTVRNVLLHGNDAPGTGLRIAHGFEARLDTVRVAYVAGCGIDIDGSCNTSYRDVFVDNCGSATEPLVKLNAIFPRTTNTVDFTGLTIERGTHPAASYLTIGDYLDATNNDYPEFIRIINAHIEAPTDNGGVAPTAPLVKIVNARNVDFVEPFIYGGPGPMIEHARTDTNLATALGGIRILGGTLLGRLASTGNQPANLVKLTSGDLFSMVGTRVEEFSGAAVLIAATYGRNVYIDPTVQTSKARTTLFSDSRPNRNPFFFAGDIQATGADSKINLSADSCPFVPGNYYAGRGVSVTTYQTAQGVMRLSMLHVGRNCTINEIGVEVTTAGSAGALLRLGIYRINKWVEGTAELLVDAGTVDASSAGYKSITIGQYVPVGETLLLAVVAQGAPATLPIVRGTSGTIPAIGATAPLTVSQAGIVGSGQNGVTDALPASHTISAAGTVPRALVKGA